MAAMDTETAGNPNRDYVLRDTGRYWHSRSYPEVTAFLYGIAVAAYGETGLRKHKGGWIRGGLFVLKSA